MKLQCGGFAEIVLINFSLKFWHVNFNLAVSFTKVFVRVFFEFHLLLAINSAKIQHLKT